MSAPSKELIDTIFREKVRQARRMSPDDRVRAGLRMFEEECEQFRMRMRQEHPDWNEDQISFVLRAHIAEQRRIDEAGVYTSFPCHFF